MSDISLPKDARKMLVAMESGPIQVVKGGWETAYILIDKGLADSETALHDKTIDGKQGLFDLRLRITSDGRIWLQQYADKKAEQRHDFFLALFSFLLGWLGPKITSLFWGRIVELLQKGGA